jgi:hypothetical protein
MQQRMTQQAPMLLRTEQVPYSDGSIVDGRRERRPDTTQPEALQRQIFPLANQHQQTPEPMEGWTMEANNRLPSRDFDSTSSFSRDVPSSPKFEWNNDWINANPNTNRLAAEATEMNLPVEWAPPGPQLVSPVSPTGQQPQQGSYSSQMSQQPSFHPWTPNAQGNIITSYVNQAEPQPQLLIPKHPPAREGSWDTAHTEFTERYLGQMIGMKKSFARTLGIGQQLRTMLAGTETILRSMELVTMLTTLMFDENEVIASLASRIVTKWRAEAYFPMTEPTKRPYGNSDQFPAPPDRSENLLISTENNSNNNINNDDQLPSLDPRWKPPPMETWEPFSQISVPPVHQAPRGPFIDLSQYIQDDALPTTVAQTGRETLKRKAKSMDEGFQQDSTRHRRPPGPMPFNQ